MIRRSPFDLARSLDLTASPTTVYRHLLRASSRHPDEHVALYFKGHWRDRAQHLLQNKLDQPTLQRRLDAARKVLRKLQRAANGVPEDFEWSLKQAYGISGKSRHMLSAPFLTPSVLPDAEPIEPGNPSTLPPTYSPLLLQMLESSTIRDNPVPSPLLLVPPTLLPQGIPRHPELFIRPFLIPRAEAVQRWKYFKSLLVERDGAWPRMRYPIVVRIVGQQPGDEDTELKLRELGVNWRAFASGEREKVLEWLEFKAGRGLEMTFEPARRSPITPQTVAELASATPEPIPAPPVVDSPPILSAYSRAHPATHDPAFPANHHLFYRRILAALPIVTIDMSKISTPHGWFTASLSPYSIKGPGLYRATTADDDGFTEHRRAFSRGKVKKTDGSEVDQK